MRIDSEAIHEAVGRAASAMVALEQELNAADAVLGDGDTGSMLMRVITAMALSAPTAPDSAASDAATALGILARAAMASTGSSLGTLIATGLLAMAKTARGLDTITIGDLAGLLQAARDAMLARGGAQLGDKTVLDALDAYAGALAGVTTPATALQAIEVAGPSVLASFRDQPCRMGRAKFYAERSVGCDDPGMLALVRLTDAIAHCGNLTKES